MNKHKIINLIVFVLLFLCAFGYAINLLYRFVKPDYKTETVFNYATSDIVNCQGIIIRDEYPLCYQTNGYIDYLVDDADAVSKKTAVLRVFSSNKSLETSNKIKEINKKIDEINSIISNKKYGSANADLIMNINKLSIESINDVKNINNIKDKIYYYLAAITLSEDEYNSLEYQVRTLKEELTDLENKLPSYAEIIYADNDGYFSKECDGLEKYLEYNIDLLNLSNIKQILNGFNAEKENNCYGKIIRSHKSYIVLKIDKSEEEIFEKYRYFTANLTDANESVELKLINVVNLDDDYYAICMCENVDEYIVNARIVDVSIKFNTYNGVKVNKLALRNYDGRDGVFCKTGNLITFKPVDVIYTSKNYVIVKSNSLREYDVVVLEGQNLYDGKVA